MPDNAVAAPEQPRQQSRALAPIDVVRRDMEAMTDQFAIALPQHVPVDRFKRIAITAINQNPDLLKADRRSMMGALMRAAQDGLLPDGREGALVMFGSNATWMPMVYGIIKKMRNSGELASITARCVYEKDKFAYVLGDDERIEHAPYLDGDPGKLRLVYAIARLKDGTTQREVIPLAAIEKVRQVSRAKNNGPWVAWYDEMARKTVIRRLSKYLPMSTEIEQVLRRDDALYASNDTVAGQIAAAAGPQEMDDFEAAATGLPAAGSAPAMIEGTASEVVAEAVDEIAGGADPNPEPVDVGAAVADAGPPDEWADELARLVKEAQGCTTLGRYTAWAEENQGAIAELRAGRPDLAAQWDVVLQAVLDTFRAKPRQQSK